jgi:hypothetical protein
VKPKRLSISSKLRLAGAAKAASGVKTSPGAAEVHTAYTPPNFTPPSTSCDSRTKKGSDAVVAADPGVAAAIASCRELRDSIGRTAAFNKLSARMTAEDVQRHYGWREQLRDSFAQLFMLWDIRATGRQITEVQAEDLDRGRSCARRIQERIR